MKLTAVKNTYATCSVFHPYAFVAPCLIKYWDNLSVCLHSEHIVLLRQPSLKCQPKVSSPPTLLGNLSRGNSFITARELFGVTQLFSIILASLLYVDYPHGKFTFHM